MLINALSNSLFIFNAQIEAPPIEFIKEAEKIKKDFLWGGGAHLKLPTTQLSLIMIRAELIIKT